MCFSLCADNFLVEFVVLVSIEFIVLYWCR